MMDKFFVVVNLAIIYVDQSKKQNMIGIVSREKGAYTHMLPSAYLQKGETTRDVALALLKKYTSLDENWVTLLQLGIVDDIDIDKNSVSILYAVFLPGHIRSEVIWTDCEMLLNNMSVSNLTKKMIREAIWRN